MPQRFFGTDGIRGRFGEAPLDQATVVALGRGIAQGLPRDASVILGGDTRESTPRLAQWITQGLRSASAVGETSNITVRWAGVLPTPAIALLTRTTDAAAGLVLSASHNPFHDNGIKVFDTQGRKLDDDAEAELESRIAAELESARSDGAASQSLELDPALNQAYLDFLGSTFGTALEGQQVILDTGHGAASAIAGRVFEAAGAQPTVICADPDGRNINAECGSTAPNLAAGEVRNTSAHLGFAFDGDADRVIVIDELGQVRDGDEILYLWAKTLKAQDALGPAAIVATSMSNLGLERALAPHGIAVERCDVGDRAVTEMLRAKSLRLGGEQSGHIIDAQRATTGDGLLTALAIAEIVNQSGRPLSKLLANFQRYPQRLLNVTVSRKPPFDEVRKIAEHAAQIEDELGSDGRLVLRYSGTEPLARVMIEAAEKATVDRLCEALAATIAEELG